MSEVNEVPKGWSIVELSDVCKKAAKVQRRFVDPNDKLIYLDIGSIDNSTNKIVAFKEYTWQNAPSRAQQIIYKDDILFSTVRTYLKNVAQVDKEQFNGQIASSGFTVIRGLKGLANPTFLFYLTLSQPFLRSLNELQTGTSYPAVRDSDVFAQKIPLPPLPEQHRIVAKIEALFSSLDKGIETLQTAQQQLKVYRQAVLKWAFEGKLPSTLIKEDSLDYHDSRNSAKNQGDQANPTNQGADKGELPEGWKWIILKEICEIRGGVTKGRNFRDKKTVHLPYLRVANVQDGYLDLNVIKDIEALETDLEKYRLLFGDILYTEGGDRDKLGRGTIWKNEVDNCIHQNHIFRARPLSDRSDSKFISYYSQTKEAKNYFLKHGKQTTNLASINITVLSNLPIPIPSTLEEQLSIVAEIESRLSVCDKIEETITQSLQQSEALRQSILKKAFEGRLVPQDPADEPASVLLARIRAEREAQPAKVKKPKAGKKEKKVEPGTQLKLL